MGRPSLSFYPDDWLNDLALRGCRPASRGIWVDILCLMHQGTPYGHLADATGPLSIRFIASRCSVTGAQLQNALKELECHGVFSRTDSGTIYSRRMVRDEYNRIVRGHGGQKSELSPSVPKKKGILPSGNEGILPSSPVVPSFGPEEGGVNKISSNGKPFDSLPGWLNFKLAYPAHRINQYTDCGIWMGIVESIETQEFILSALEKFKHSEQWLKESGKFVPSAARFLGQRMFETEPGPQEENRWKRTQSVTP